MSQWRAKTSLADGTNLDGSVAEAKTRKNKNMPLFLTALSVDMLEGKSYEKISPRLGGRRCEVSLPGAM
jgi:hypothetical protein